MIVISLLLVFASHELPAQTSTEAYATILKKVARADGVKWEAFGDAEKKLFTEHMQWLEKASLVRLTDPKEQLAFWINARNACAMKIILENMPLEDVMKIVGFRDRKSCNIAGAERTLVFMESGVIRPLFTDPRVLFSLWWGTRGGPRLREKPYEAATLDASLDEMMKEAVANPRFVKVRRTSVELSPFFDWFKDDFGKGDAAVLKFVKKNLPKDKAAKFPTDPKRAKYMAFDWNLDRSTAP
jgi:hypothetical protein